MKHDQANETLCFGYGETKLGLVLVAWFKTGGLWVTSKVARAVPTKEFHVSRVALIGFRGGEARIRKLGCEHLVREQRRE